MLINPQVSPKADKLFLQTLKSQYLSQQSIHQKKVHKPYKEIQHLHHKANDREVKM